MREWPKKAIEYNRELSDVVTKAGGEPANDTSVPGKIYHAWMDVKATFSGEDTKSTLVACEFGEDAAQKAYAKALEKESPLPRDVYDLIARQKSLLKGSHDLDSSISRSIRRSLIRILLSRV